MIQWRALLKGDNVEQIDDFKRILVAIDGSECSARVIARASSIAVAASSDVHLISVVEVPGAIASEEELETPELQFEGKKLIDCQKELIDKYLAGYNLNVKSHVSYGDPDNEILDYADAIGADLIVVGRGKCNRALRLFLGSISEEVMKKAKCSVMIAR